MKTFFSSIAMRSAWCGAVLLCAACGLPDEPLDRVGEIWELYHDSPEAVLVVAHRGAHADVPENSLASIDKAVEAGVHIVELDIQQTKDGVFVAMHDRVLDRTTTGTGELADYTYAELQSVRLLHQGNPTDYRIPTLEEAVGRAKGRVLLDIDFKVHGLQARFDVFDELTRLDAEDLVLFYCYDYTELPVLHAYNPRIKIMPRAYDLVQFKEIVELGLTDIIHVDGSFYSSEAVEKIVNEKPIRIWANVLGRHDQQAAQHGSGAYRSFFDKLAPVNVVQTDQPHLLTEYLAQETDRALVTSASYKDVR